MAQSINRIPERISLDSRQTSLRFSEGSEILQITGCMLDRGAAAISLPNGFLFTKKANRTLESVLMSTEEALQKLCNLRLAATALGKNPVVFACTSAREAQVVASKDDPRDQRFLTGVITIDNHHGYCGGMNNAIGRALAYAEAADVICYKVSEINLSEAERFALEVREALPNKLLGFGHVFAPCEFKQQEPDYAALEKKLHKMGYEYFFFTEYGSMIFPSFPDANPWVLFDDQETLAGEFRGR